jgi:hypothetical protein
MHTNPLDVQIIAISKGALRYAPVNINAPFRGGNYPDMVEKMTNMWIADEDFVDSLGIRIRRSMFAEFWPDTKSTCANWSTGPQEGGAWHMDVTLFTEAPYVRERVTLLEGNTWCSCFKDRRAAQGAVERAWAGNQAFGLFGKGQGTMTPEQLIRIVSKGSLTVAINFVQKSPYGGSEYRTSGWCTLDVKTGKVW